jgi:hypothetical protein
MCPALRLVARPDSEANEVIMSDFPERTAAATPVLTSLPDLASNPDGDRIVFLAKDTPPEFLDQLEAIAAGNFAAAGLKVGKDERTG